MKEIINETVCFGCKHLIKYPRCKAFKIIPQEIRDGENNHSKPLPEQDNGIVFEPMEETEP